MKFGIYEKAINSKFSWLEKIKIAKAAGFDFLELSIDESDEKLARLDWSNKEINSLKNILVKNNFYINSICLSAHRKYPFGSQKEVTRAKAMLIMKKAIKLCKFLNIPIIQLAGYDVFYETSNKFTKKFFLDGCIKASKLAAHYSIMLAFETMDTPFMGTIIKGMEYIKKIQSPWLNLYPDIGNLWQHSSNPEKEIETHINHIVAFHLKETTLTQFRDLNFGQGTVNFDSIFKVLKKTEYNGPVVIEMWSKNVASETVNECIEKIKIAKNFNKEKMKKAGIDV